MPFSPLETVPVELLADGRMRVTADVVWTGSDQDTVTVAAGTVSDLASVPWFMRAIVATGGKASRAALVHDVLCDQLNARHKAVKAWEAKHGDRERANAVVERYMHGQYVILPPRPAPLPFGPVDTDGAFRRILAELKVPLVSRWLYWVGVRWGALANPARRAGWFAPGLLARVLPLTVLALVLCTTAAVGALISGLLIGLARLLTWPFDRRPARRPGDATTTPRRGLRARPLERQRLSTYCALYLTDCIPGCAGPACPRLDLPTRGADGQLELG